MDTTFNPDRPLKSRECDLTRKIVVRTKNGQHQGTFSLFFFLFVFFSLLFGRDEAWWPMGHETDFGERATLLSPHPRKAGNSATRPKSLRMHVNFIFKNLLNFTYLVAFNFLMFSSNSIQRKDTKEKKL